MGCQDSDKFARNEVDRRGGCEGGRRKRRKRTRQQSKKKASTSGLYYSNLKVHIDFKIYIYSIVMSTLIYHP